MLIVSELVARSAFYSSLTSTNRLRMRLPIANATPATFVTGTANPQRAEFDVRFVFLAEYGGERDGFQKAPSTHDSQVGRGPQSAARNRRGGEIFRVLES
jgi:hypothetical protein